MKFEKLILKEFRILKIKLRHQHMKELKKEKKFEIGSGLVLSVVMMEITTWNDGWLLWIKKKEKSI